jgi:hypothetical protein
MLLMMAKMDQRLSARIKGAEVIDLRSKKAGDTVQ